MKKRKKKLSLCFVNLFIPVVPLYSKLHPHLSNINITLHVLMSSCRYRLNHGDVNREYEVKRVYFPRFFKNGKRWAAFSFYFLAPFFLIQKKTLTIFLTQPPFFVIIGAFICRIMRFKYGIHVMDMHPDLFVCLKYLKEGNIIVKWLNNLMVSAMSRAEFVVAIGRCMEQRLIEKGLDAANIHVIPNWAHDELTVKPQEVFRKKHNLYGKFIVLYSGNMGFPHKFDSILKVAENYEKNEDILFVFAGTGKRRKEIEACKYLKNVILLPPQPFDIFPEMLKSVDLHFISQMSGFEGVLVPSKFYGSLQSGRPIIFEGPENCEISLVIKEANCGAVIPCGDFFKLQTEIEKRFKNKNLCSEEGLRARKVYKNSYSSDISCKKYTRIIKDYI